MASTSDTLQNQELAYLVIQLLEEENFKESARELERESKLYLNMKYVEEAVAQGKWEELENYIHGFTRINENDYSMQIFFQIRQHKYYEALCKGEHSKAMEVLRKDLTRFTPYYRDHLNAIALLLYRSVDDLRVAGYDIDTQSGRCRLFAKLKGLIQLNPVLTNKIKFPKIENTRLKKLLNQSLNWQHSLCKCPETDPGNIIKTLYEDHRCIDNAHGAMVPSNAAAYPPEGGYNTAFQLAPGHAIILHDGRRNIPYPAAPQATSGRGLNTINYTENEIVQRGSGASGFSEKVKIISPVADDAGPSGSYTSCSFGALPTNVYANLTQASAVTSIDFHPINQTLLLGMEKGQVALWDVGSRNRLACRNFTIWNLRGCSVSLQSNLLEREYSASVNRVMWSPGGVMFGVAYSKHIVHIYSYHGDSTLQNNLEIEAHVGSVNDIAFSYNESLCFITCGDDKTVKVWDAVDGSLQYTLTGHEGAVYSLCPRHRQNIKFIYSTSLDGKIKRWLCDATGPGPRVSTHYAPALRTTMMYSTDETRLFLCGGQRGGTSHIVEWDESEDNVGRSYLGLVNPSWGSGVVHFDTTMNKYLAAGDEYIIKFWDMDNDKIFKTTDAGGGLPWSPCIRFNKDGTLLAVSTNHCSVKILWTGQV